MQEVYISGSWGEGGERSKAGIHVTVQGPQSHAAYGLKESFEI